MAVLNTASRFTLISSVVFKHIRKICTTGIKCEQITVTTIDHPVSELPVAVHETEDTGTEDEKYEHEIRVKILTASLPFVNEFGWSREAIAAGAEIIGYPGVIHGLFPRGGAELIQYFYTDCNKQLANKLKEDMEQKILPTEPVEVMRNAIETRLRMIIPYKSRWPQALAIMSLPPNVPTSLANLLTLSDDICYFAGDRSVDFTWYGRRVGLAAIYKMTELYFLQDQTENHTATWSFLMQRVSEAVAMNSILRQSETATQQAKDTVSSAIIMARNIIGVNWRR